MADSGQATTKRKRRTAVVLAFGVIVCGVAAWALYHGTLLGLRGLDMGCDPFWEARFLQRTADVDQPFVQHDVHPTRGWTPKPHLHRVSEYTETTNDRGQRALVDYAPHPDKFTVMIVGDSFTYGAWSDDSEVWPTILQGLDDRCYIVNLAVGGYGVDQMYVTERESIEEYKPNMVIMAAISDDLNRCLLSFREYRKPRFVIGSDGQLLQTTTPIGDFSDTLRYLRSKYGYWGAREKLWAEDARLQKRRADGLEMEERNALMDKLIEASVVCAKSHGSGFLFLQLAFGAQIAGPPDKPREPDEVLCETWARAHGAAFLATRQAFLDAGGHWTQGHYHKPEAELVARLVHEALVQSPEFADFMKGRS